MVNTADKHAHTHGHAQFPQPTHTLTFYTPTTFLTHTSHQHGHIQHMRRYRSPLPIWIYPLMALNSSPSHLSRECCLALGHVCEGQKYPQPTRAHRIPFEVCKNRFCSLGGLHLTCILTIYSPHSTTNSILTKVRPCVLFFSNLSPTPPPPYLLSDFQLLLFHFIFYIIFRPKAKLDFALILSFILSH